MKRNHQNQNVIQQLSTHCRYALLVFVLAAPSAYAAPVLRLISSLRPIRTTTESYRATKRVIISSSKFSLHAM